MIDSRLKSSSTPSYGQIITDIEAIIKGIEKVQKKAMTGDKLMNGNLRPVIKQVRPDSVFSIKVEEFFSRSPIDLEFYDFNGFGLVDIKGEDIIMYKDMDTFIGVAPKNLKNVEFEIAIMYYKVYDYGKYTFNLTYTKLILEVTNYLEVEEPVPLKDEQSQASKGIFSKSPFIWKLFIIILVLCMTLFIVWLLLKIYKAGYFFLAWKRIVNIMSCILSTLEQGISFIYRRFKKKPTRAVNNNIK